MTHYNSLNLKQPNPQINKLKSSIKSETNRM